MMSDYWYVGLKKCLDLRNAALVANIALTLSHAEGVKSTRTVFLARVDPLGVEFDPRYLLTFSSYVLHGV